MSGNLEQGNYEQAAVAERRTYRVSVGTHHGYAASAMATRPDLASGVVRKWIEGRMSFGLPYLTGILTAGDVVYGWRDPQGVPQTRVEPCVVFSGVLSPDHDRGMEDATAVECLEDLGSALASFFGQTRVYLEFRDRVWILQRRGSPTPRTA